VTGQINNSSQEILELLLKRRKHSLADRNYLKDGSKLGLVIEGGGMRGVISCAMVDALYQLGFGKCFDVVVGNSAGAMNGAYFLSGQITMGTSVFYQNLVRKQFVKLSQFPDIMNLNYLFDEWITNKKALNIKALKDSQSELVICTTRVFDGTSRYFTNRGSDVDHLIKALKASSSTPYFTQNTENIQGEIYSDGLINDAIPARIAIEKGCDHLVCVLTRPIGYRKSKSYLLSLLAWLQTRQRSSSYRRALALQSQSYNSVLGQIESGFKGNVKILVIAPKSKEVISSGETRALIVRNAAIQGMKRAALILGLDDKSLKLYDELTEPKRI